MTTLFSEYKLDETKLHDLFHMMIQSGSEEEQTNEIEDLCKDSKYGNYDEDKEKSDEDTDSDEDSDDDDDEKIHNFYEKEPLYVSPSLHLSFCF